MPKHKIEVVHYLIETVEIEAESEHEALLKAIEDPDIGSTPSLKDYSHTGYFFEDPEHY